jgi:hypothetical protein
MKKIWVRSTVVGSIFSLFLIVVISLTGCDTDSLGGMQNFMGGGNGPGSGSWDPPKPQTIRQARQLYTVLETLVKNTNEETAKYEQGYVDCLDEAGKPLSGEEKDPCIQQLVDSWVTLHHQFKDFRTGSTVYTGWAQENVAAEVPLPPDLPGLPKYGAPPTISNDTDPDPDPGPDYGCPPWCCLTCTQRIDVEFVYQPLDLAQLKPQN